VVSRVVSVLDVVVLVVGLESLQVVSFLSSPSCSIRGWEES
jgi:hypothetical protein